MNAIDQGKINADGEWARRRKLLEALLDYSMGKTFEFEERDIMQPCVGHIGNNFASQEPTGDKEFVVRVKVYKRD